MKIKKIRKYIIKQVKKYPLYESLIIDLENSKGTAEGNDINSSIRSKYKISRTVENQAINNIKIDNKISELKKWKQIISNSLEEFKEENETVGRTLEYRFIGNMSEDKIAEELYISRGCIRNYINDFIMEITIIAISENLINIDKICYNNKENNVVKEVVNDE